MWNSHISVFRSFSWGCSGCQRELCEPPVQRVNEGQAAFREREMAGPRGATVARLTPDQRGRWCLGSWASLSPAVPAFPAETLAVAFSLLCSQNGLVSCLSAGTWGRTRWRTFHKQSFNQSSRFESPSPSPPLLEVPDAAKAPALCGFWLTNRVDFPHSALLA